MDDRIDSRLGKGTSISAIADRPRDACSTSKRKLILRGWVTSRLNF